MRLQLTAFVFAALTTASAQAQDAEPWTGEATGRVLVYSDDDATSVVTTIVDASEALPHEVSVGAYALVDAVSSASVDVVTAATGRWQETRVEFGARVRGELAKTGVTVALTRSQENDWRSNAASIAIDRELFERNLRLSASYGLTLNDVGRAMDPTFERSVTSHSGEVSVSQLVDDKTRVGGALSVQRLSGFLASPYRFVVAADGIRGPERHPETRFRASASGYGLRALGDYLAARVGYRFYRDDWGIASHTATASMRGEIDRWFAAAEARAYWQDRADFYRPVYETSFRYMSNDRELATFYNVGGNVQLGARVGPFALDAKVGVVHYRFRNFPALKRRNALLAGGGIKAAW